MKPSTVFSPAKLNLFLAVTGRRADGYHDLVSVAATVNFGDTLRFEATAATDGTALACSDPELAVDESNLVLRAVRAFRERTGWTGGVRIFLEKRIPLGAGLGGGSSNATATLRALNTLAGGPLGPEGLTALAGQLGSDCTLFLHDGPVVMRGRGERVELLPPAAAARLRGRRVLLFKPSFGISTAWAYQQLAKTAPASCLPASEAEARLAAWLGDPAAPAEALLFNNLEPVAFRKFLALPALIESLCRDCGVAVHMSGSGSACFALLAPEADAAPPVARIRDAWGPDAFLQETVIF